MMEPTGSRELRDVLGTFATGVTVVATQTRRGPVGMTANSFAAVSLNPPLVLFSVARRSQLSTWLGAADCFAVTILAESQRELARQFARPGFDRFGSVPWSPGETGAPVLADGLAALECRVVEVHTGGDHLIILGQVVTASIGRSQRPLLFFRGHFDDLGGLEETRGQSEIERMHSGRTRLSSTTNRPPDRPTGVVSMVSEKGKTVEHQHEFDVVVIGGGPGGASAGAKLAQQGFSTLVVEKATFPRFHIGESLLPYMAGLLDQMGLLEGFRSGGYVAKCGAEFTDENGCFRRVSFEDQGPGRYHQTFQVERSRFDTALLDHARSSGAEVVTPATMNRIVVDDGRVVGMRYRLDGEDHHVRCRYVLDASGRSGRIAQMFGLRRTVESLRMVAVYRHFAGVSEENNPGCQGDIQIGNHADGWVWAIPVSDDAISIGTVMTKDTFRRESPEVIFAEHYGRVPRIAKRLHGTAPRTELRIETDYCYVSDQVTGPGWFMIGDAGCFVDPIFSGGVYLAMVTGRQAAHEVARALRDPAHADTYQASYESFFKTGYDTYFRLIHGFYEHDCNFKKYRESLPAEVEERAVALLLAGDFWSQGNALARTLRAQRDWDTFAPFEPYFGCPVYPELEMLERVDVRI